jgi:RNase P subunit RPR2
MVKIVGKDERAVKRTTCVRCASILEYTLNEVSRIVVRDYGGGSDSYNTIQCPNCASSIQVKGY